MIRLLSFVTRWGFYISLLLAALTAGYESWLGLSGADHFNRLSRGLSNLFGAGAELALALAVGRWLVRRVLLVIRRAQLDDYHLLPDLFAYFRDYHVMFGWAAIVAASVHGLYFLVVDPRFGDKAISGWLAWGALVLLVSIGYILDQRLDIRVGRRHVYVYHVSLAVLFLLAATVHAAALFTSIAVWVVAAGGAIVLWLGRKVSVELREGD